MSFSFIIENGGKIILQHLILYQKSSLNNKLKFILILFKDIKAKRSCDTTKFWNACELLNILIPEYKK